MGFFLAMRKIFKVRVVHRSTHSLPGESVFRPALDYLGQDDGTGSGRESGWIGPAKIQSYPERPRNLPCNNVYIIFNQFLNKYNGSEIKRNTSYLASGFRWIHRHIS